MLAGPRKSLTLFDSTCLIVGIIVGVGIYQTPPMVAGGMPGRWGLLAIWLVGGLISLAGALCYAELATTYPQAGGDYIYLRRAFGRWAGFLFAWGRVLIVYPGDIAAMAFAFATYAASLHAPLPYAEHFYAVAAVAVLTTVNVLGVREGKWTQNLLTVLKVGGLLAIVAVAYAAAVGPAEAPAGNEALELSGLEVALVLVLFTFGGWNEMAYVAAEVRNPRRNILRALLLGTACVTVLYLVVNAAYYHVLGSGMAEAEAVASEAVATALAVDGGGPVIAGLVCLSALGAVNGLIFTGARVSYAMGTEHPAFRAVGRWSETRGTPATALLLQGALAIGVILLAGSFIEAVFYTALVVWVFFGATGVALFVLRWREPGVDRPYRVSGYPVTPLLFCLTCGFMVYSAWSFAIDNRPRSLPVAGVLLALGVIVYCLTEVYGPSRSPQRQEVDGLSKERSGSDG